jgi:hypothetical protein
MSVSSRGVVVEASSGKWTAAAFLTRELNAGKAALIEDGMA